MSEEGLLPPLCPLRPQLSVSGGAECMMQCSEPHDTGTGEPTDHLLLLSTYSILHIFRALF